MNGSKFTGLNGGAHFRFNEAVSFVVTCDTQDEIDFYWETLTGGGGNESMCGWLKERFSLSWQIVPAVPDKLLSDPVKGQRVGQALMKMKKLDIKTLATA